MNMINILMINKSAEMCLNSIKLISQYNIMNTLSIFICLSDYH